MANSITFEQFFSAISEQESGGNYKAVGVPVNGDRAYGKYQVMGANIPSWTKQYLGYSMTPQQFLNSPSAQEKVARGKLKGYYDKYGPRGAAAMWYSGQSDPSKTYGNPPVYRYVNDVMSKGAKYPSGGGKSSSSSASSGGGGGAGAAKKGRAETAEEYGFMLDLFDSDPELKKLFNKAVAASWSSSKFQAELRDTKWWKKNSQTARDFLVLQSGDPATAKQKLSQEKMKVRQLAESMGMHVDDKMLKKIDKWALQSIMGGWSEGQLRNELGKFVTFGDDGWGGEGGEVIEKLKSYAYSMGVDPAGSFFADGARLVIRGLATEQDYQDKMRKMAKATFSGWSDQIDAGMTVADIASPYFQSMAQILELPSGSINLFDPTIKKALQYKDKNTGANAPKPLWQFENDLRSDSRWKSTQNAQNSMMQIAHQVLADFGVKT